MVNDGHPRFHLKNINFAFHDNFIRRLASDFVTFVPRIIRRRIATKYFFMIYSFSKLSFWVVKFGTMTNKIKFK